MSKHSGGRGVIGPLVVGVAVVFFFVWLFAAALHQPEPHDLRIGLVGPAVAAENVRAGAMAQAPGVFFFSTYSTEDAARTAIQDRDIVGALIIGAGQPRILIASAGGLSASSTVSAALTAMASAMGQTAIVEDVQPLPSSDSRGLVPFFLSLAVSISAFIFAALAWSQLARFSLSRKIGALALFAVVDGFIASLAVSIVLGFESSYWSLAGVCMLLALAVAAGTAACLALFGRAGMAVAGLLLILLGNASSGSVIGAAFLPQPFRWLSAVLPSGPALESARSVLYFGGAGTSWRLWTLAIWAVGSLLVLAAAHAWQARATERPAEVVGP
jgi:hypothetical protein